METRRAQRERLLRTTQRRMMRKILRNVRRPARVIDYVSDSSSESVGGSTVNKEDCDDQPMKEDGTWVEWLKRTTGIVEKQLKAAGLDDWVVSQRKRKWAFAGHVARREDGRWSQKVLQWEPSDGCRSRGTRSNAGAMQLTIFLSHLMSADTGGSPSLKIERVGLRWPRSSLIVDRVFWFLRGLPANHPPVGRRVGGTSPWHCTCFFFTSLGDPALQCGACVCSS